MSRESERAEPASRQGPTVEAAGFKLTVNSYAEPVRLEGNVGVDSVSVEFQPHQVDLLVGGSTGDHPGVIYRRVRSRRLVLLFARPRAGEEGIRLVVAVDLDSGELLTPPTFGGLRAAGADPVRQPPEAAPARPA